MLTMTAMTVVEPKWLFHIHNCRQVLCLCVHLCRQIKFHNYCILFYRLVVGQHPDGLTHHPMSRSIPMRTPFDANKKTQVDVKRTMIPCLVMGTLVQVLQENCIRVNWYITKKW